MSERSFFGGTEPSPTRRELLKLGALGGAAAIAGYGYYHEQEQRRALHQQTPSAEAMRGSSVERLRALEERRFRIPANQPTFLRLREAGVFSRGTAWSTTASTEAFHEMGMRMAGSQETRGLLNQEELRFVVPAAGSLLSPLDLAFQFAERSPVVKTIHLAASEISTDSARAWEARLREMVASLAAIEGFRLQTRSFPPTRAKGEASSVTEARFIYKNGQGRGVEIVIQYEVNRSGERYMRPEAADQADILVLHDIDRKSDSLGSGYPELQAEKTAGDLYTLLRESTQRPSHKARYAIMEYREEDEPFIPASVGRLLWRIPGQYFGCGENHMEHGTKSERSAYAVSGAPRGLAALLELNTPLLAAMANADEGLIQAYITMASPAELLVKLSFAPRENIKLLTDVVQSVQRMEDGIVRRQMIMLAQHHLRLIELRPQIIPSTITRIYRERYAPLIQQLARLM